MAECRFENYQSRFRSWTNHCAIHNDIPALCSVGEAELESRLHTAETRLETYNNIIVTLGPTQLHVVQGADDPITVPEQVTLDALLNKIELLQESVANCRHLLRKMKAALLSYSQLMALASFLTTHGNIESNAVCLTALVLKQKAQAVAALDK